MPVDGDIRDIGQNLCRPVAALGKIEKIATYGDGGGRLAEDNKK